MIYPYRLADLPVHNIPFAHLPYVRGHLDTLVPQPDGSLRVCGWVAAPGEPVDAIEVHHEGRRLAAYPILPRPDVQDFYRWLPHGELSGFDFLLPLSAAQASVTSRLDLITIFRNERRGRLSQLVRTDVDQFPTPPDDFIYRVSHIRKAHSFKVSGLKSLGDFLEPFSRHADMSKTRRNLDWGCGSGRMTMCFLAAQDCPELVGCDIDGQAVAWCNEHLQPGAFSIVNAMPPAPYPSGRFDFIDSYSVLTHLTRATQRAWLREMHRLLVPGGLFIATTHGQLAYSFARRSLSVRFPFRGIDDSSRDGTLGVIAPRGYYRSTYQSKKYTLGEFSRLFLVLEYVERGATNFQDLIVARK
jgi:SAM-dependent methyltransferase